MKSSEDFIELTNKLQDLFQERDNSYTLCVVIGDIECALLRFINKINRPMTMKEIAELYNITNTKVTRVLNKLVKMGFVERYHSQTDRRSLYARITEEGRRMADNAKYKLNQFQKNILDKIPEEDIDKTYQYLKKFIDAYAATIEESKNMAEL